MPPRPLDPAGVARAARILARRDPRLGAVVRELGPPPLWGRRPGFVTLVHMILEQQVSLASAKACLDKLRARVRPLTPAGFLELDDVTLREIGFSRQKTRYARDLAREIRSGRFRPGELARLGDDAVRDRLVRLTGIGPWTADVYLLMALRRPDVWPGGDLALEIAAREYLGHEGDRDAWTALAEDWRPYRSVAARILWTWYLEMRPRRRGRGPESLPG